MGFTDKMCYEVATKIINNIFWVNYEPTIKQNKTWYENLNKFLVKEWDRLQETEDVEDKFTDEEEHMITVDAMQLLLDKLNVDEDDFEDHEQDVDWSRFDDIIGHYTLLV
tara:strand:+ start:1956 stop:2285 length:330 start_codon:yes stop_codon:yes gene_type:complete